jgi:hypothetical protein
MSLGHQEIATKGYNPHEAKPSHTYNTSSGPYELAEKNYPSPAVLFLSEEIMIGAQIHFEGAGAAVLTLLV